MSGFLHRLAAQALGQAPEIRPPARQRWGAGANGAREIAAQETAASPSLERTEMEEAPVAATAPDIADEAFGQPMARATRPGAAPQATIQVTSARHSETSVAAPRPSDKLGPVAPPVRRAEALVERGEPHAERGSAVSARASRDVPPRTEPARREEARVVTREAPAIAMPRAPAADAAHRPAGEAAHHTPDVHIHIGRVELTALTPPAPPRREPAAKRVSLDDYLRRSNRTSS
jgi:hypothetical protein